MAGDLPARIDRAALERILQRATELQAGERDIGENLTPDEVMALGREVGIPQRYLQQAMLEERTRVAQVAVHTGWERLAGPGGVTAQRVIAGTVPSVADALVEYMDRHELLCVQRRQADRITWEPLGGFQAAIRRSGAAFSGRQPFLLDKANPVAAALTPLEDGYVHVLLRADLRGYRSGFVGGGAALAAVGAAATIVLVTLGAFLPVALLPLPAGAGAGYAVLRQFPPKVERVQLGLERALDHLEQGTTRPKHELPRPPRPGIVGMIMDEVRRRGI